MLMDTNLDANQLDYAQTAHECGKDLISLINEVLDQAKIESGRLELEKVPFDLRSVLDNVLSLFSSRSNEKGIEVSIQSFSFSNESSVAVSCKILQELGLSLVMVLLGEGSWLFMSLIGCQKLLLVTLVDSAR